jgi:DNA-binding response OmpR family regulator
MPRLKSACAKSRGEQRDAVQKSAVRRRNEPMCEVDIGRAGVLADPLQSPSMPPHERILIADDDDFIRLTISAVLRQNGYRVLEAKNGREALERSLKDLPALAIMDIEMPEMGGLAAIERLRKLGNPLPVLVLSGRGSVEERVQGLNVGADDYLVKPFEGDELLARVRALLRRHDRKNVNLETLQLGNAQVDLGRKVVVIDGETVPLSRIECSILELLVRNSGRPVSRKEMLDVAWGYTYLPSTRTVDTHIWRLRKKIGDGGKQPRWIKNVPSAGYMLDLETPNG